MLGRHEQALAGKAIVVGETSTWQQTSTCSIGEAVDAKAVFVLQLQVSQMAPEGV